MYTCSVFFHASVPYRVYLGSLSNVLMALYRKHEGPAKLFDEGEERARLQERQKLFKDYRTKRQEVMQIRNADREQRNKAKIKQLEEAEQWQVLHAWQ